MTGIHIKIGRQTGPYRGVPQMIAKIPIYSKKTYEYSTLDRVKTRRDFRLCTYVANQSITYQVYISCLVFKRDCRRKAFTSITGTLFVDTSHEIQIYLTTCVVFLSLNCVVVNGRMCWQSGWRSIKEQAGWLAVITDRVQNSRWPNHIVCLSTIKGSSRPKEATLSEKQMTKIQQQIIIRSISQQNQSSNMVYQ